MSNETSSTTLVLCCGARHWTDGRTILERLSREPEGTIIIEGGQVAESSGNAKRRFGADYLARCAAHLLGFRVITIEAEWDIHGKAAGPIRNSRMIELGPAKLIAFNDDLENSRGTKDCWTKAWKRGIPCELVRSINRDTEPSTEQSPQSTDGR